MKATPILFSAPMVRAILDGRKTQTRRIVREGIAEHINAMGEGVDGEAATSETVIFKYGKWADDRSKVHGPEWCVFSEEYQEEGCIPIGQCPYGKVGDLLWVRETFGTDLDGEFFYRATDTEGCGDDLDDPWKKSIHMPRKASRITLEIAAIRIERLQDISEADAGAEGMDTVRYYTHPTEGVVRDTGGYVARSNFRSLWESIKGKGAWDANPWVWVIEFKPHLCNVDDFIAKRGGAI